MARHARREDEYTPLTARRLSRRRALTRGAALAAGAAGVTALSTTPAEAASGDPILAGNPNDAQTGTTGLSSKSDVVTFYVVNSVNGTAVEAIASGSNGTALRATNTGGGTAISATSAGYGLVVQGGKAPLYLRPAEEFGPPTTGHHYPGELMVDAAGRQYVCFAEGDPGAWARPGFNPVSPFRVCDTRLGTGTPYSTGVKVGAGVSLEVAVAGSGGPIPLGVSAVTMNVTVTEPTGSSYLTIYPALEARPTASVINFTPGQTIANGFTSKVSAGSSIKIFNSAGAVHVIVDVSGYYV